MTLLCRILRKKITYFSYEVSVTGWMPLHFLLQVQVIKLYLNELIEKKGNSAKLHCLVCLQTTFFLVIT